MHIRPDPVAHIEVYNFGFRCIKSDNGNNLPGERIDNPQVSHIPSAIDAYENTLRVQDFLYRYLDGYSGVDGRGKPFILSINCLDGCDGSIEPKYYCYELYQFPCVIDASHSREYPYSCFSPPYTSFSPHETPLFIYGQIRDPNNDIQFISGASCLTTVAHEIFHAVMYFQSGQENLEPRLEMDKVSGALAESYSDIFSVIVTNTARSNLLDISQWDWKIYNFPNQPLRNLQYPNLSQDSSQAIHMDEYERTYRNTRIVEYYNAGIHNLAAYRIITALDRNMPGKHLFYDDAQGIIDIAGIVKLFYEGLKDLSSNANFTDSRNSLCNAVGSAFAGDPRQSQIEEAIDRAFDSVGIPEYRYDIY
jgi:hypothetical protein